MSAVEAVRAIVPVRRPGDGMEMYKPAVAPEITLERVPKLQLKVPVPRHTPLMAAQSQSAGVLSLGKVSRETCMEVEVVRIMVPRAAISRTSCLGGAEWKGDVGMLAEDQLSREDLRTAMEKLQNSEQRLLQDKEGITNQLRVQTEVNRELKKLLVASVGDDLQYHFERLVREKNQVTLENEALCHNLAHTAEQLERMSIQCDVWRSKFLASRVMAEELTNARVALQRHTREAQSAIQDLLSEKEEFTSSMMHTHRLLEQLLVSLQWGRQQTYYPSTKAFSTGELAVANHKLANAINSHLLGNVSSSRTKGSQLSELCNTPAEKMAVKVLKNLDLISFSDKKYENLPSDTVSSTFLPSKKSIGRFHPYTRYENITFNCCERCSGDILVL